MNLKLTLLAILLVAATAVTLVPAPVASACPITPESDPCAPPCLVNVQGACVVRQPCGVKTPCPESSTSPDVGACARARTPSCPGFVCVWTAAKYTCVDPVLACGPGFTETMPLAQVHYDGCAHVDGYACVPAWYGGRGLLGGFVLCNREVAFSLP